MEPLYDYAWLIPALPLAGATVVGIGLISVNRLTNQLRQLNAALIMTLLGLATGHSFALLWSQLQGHAPYQQSFEWAAAGSFHISMGYIMIPSRRSCSQW